MGASSTMATAIVIAACLFVARAGAVRPPPGAADGGEQRRSIVELVQRARGAQRAKAAADPTVYQHTEPIIGVLTQPCSDCPGKSYIAASYVHWIESAGGRVAPIRFYASDAELKRLFNSVNGLVFAGGLTWLWLDSPYVATARKLFNWAVEANDAGNPFPIHGTCLGHQLLHILVSNVSRNDLLVETDAVEHPSVLDFTPAAKDSRTFGGMDADLLAKLADPTLNIAMENHEYGIPPAHYKRWPILGEWFDILTTTKDRQGLEYISTVEAKKYPFTGTQWHPEKPVSEHGMDTIPHTLDAVRVGQWFANRFVDTARYSSNGPASHEQELADLIYSTPPVFSARFETLAEDNYDGPYMTYYFDHKDKPPSGPDDDEHEGGGDPDPSRRA
ncbi:gamma-glutamyl hydrolase [Raphidocelis subcapitata]|uniref:folate gamma-glutamyl hydrolase n=1 Tax=Raphidocelis subcapitata TaxID=307507 RepID=A0A2V0P5E7_9CHLO|nr:gamma-glutamyl hydrolase [Raphidocelis subcapitata]|eukprot:GBF95078.1 gamma-glutamyl hydrolase [Raphidocelis subcapitata]